MNSKFLLCSVFGLMTMLGGLSCCTQGPVVKDGCIFASTDQTHYVVLEHDFIQSLFPGSHGASRHIYVRAGDIFIEGDGSSLPTMIKGDYWPDGHGNMLTVRAPKALQGRPVKKCEYGIYCEECQQCWSIEVDFHARIVRKIILQRVPDEAVVRLPNGALRLELRKADNR